MERDRIEQFLHKFPHFPSVIETLEKNNIPWMIGGSGCLFLLGNKREPDDVDIFLRNEDHDSADKAFSIESFIYSSVTETVRNSNPFGEHAMQLTSHLKIHFGDKIFDLHITDSVLANRKKIESTLGDIWLLPPEDVLLIKGILQRGSDVGKKDLEDIKNFMALYTIDKEYLKLRIRELQAEERTQGIFN